MIKGKNYDISEKKTKTKEMLQIKDCTEVIDEKRDEIVRTLDKKNIMYEI